MAGDAARTPIRGEYLPLEVSRVGVVQARQPMPRAAAALASAATGRGDGFGFLNTFVTDHIADEEYTRLLIGMIESEFPAETMQLVARGLATWGTGRPYAAVCTLCAITSVRYRLLRAKLLAAGITDPMTLPNLHSLLDFTEQMVVEWMGNGEPKKAERDIARFYDSLYAPEKVAAEGINGDGYKPVPAGFEGSDVEASFDAAMKMAR